MSRTGKTGEEKNVHAGHRQRMRERFIQHGLSNFNDVNVLELLLFYALPGKDTNPIAHRLMDTFGTLDGVFDASTEALKTVPGVSEATAVLLHLVPEAAQRYFTYKNMPGDILRDSSDVGAYMKPRFLTCRNETLYLICLDAKLKVLDCREVGQGNTTSVPVNTRKIMQIALSQNASVVILAHNHTSGIAIPSEEDIAATRRLKKLLAQVGIVLTEHIVVAGDDFVSMADSGFLDER